MGERAPLHLKELESVGQVGSQELHGRLVARARAAVDDLNNDASDGSLSDADHAALEAVLFMRGRPALNVEGDQVVAFEEKPEEDGGWINGGVFCSRPLLVT